MNYLPENCPATAVPKTAPRPKSAAKLAQYKRASVPFNYGREEEEEERDSTALDKFLNFILQPKFAYYTFIAHYGQAFDCILLLNRLLKRQIQCEPIFEGNKAILIRLPQFHMRFVDSHRYIKSPLDKFPSRFPKISSLLPLGEAAKGVFPYRFNRPENYFYVGPLPDKAEFVDDFASSSKVAKVEKFLNGWPQDKMYDFQSELHLYLQADIKVLMAGVSCLLQEFYQFQAELQMKKKDEEKIFFHCFATPFLTLPQFLHSLWRTFGMHYKLYLLSDQTLARKDGIGELEWLAYEQENMPEGQMIRTARSHPQGQQRMGPFTLDGYWLREGGDGGGGGGGAGRRLERAWEFLGCAVHCHWLVKSSCPLTRGMRATDKNPFGEAPWQVMQRFRRKERFLSEQGIHLTYVWECTWEEAKKRDPRIELFLTRWRDDALLPRRRLAAREGLRGGRCETFRLLFDLNQNPDRKMFYIDKNSLYPTVAIEEVYPVGPAETLIGKQLESRLDITAGGVRDRLDGKECLGLLQATLLAPESLFLPVLPIMSTHKLMFGLCSTCISERKARLCTHEGPARFLTDVWTIPEVTFALECGYTLIRAHEALIYKEKAPLFKDFYAGLARMKLESEAPPSNCNIDEYVAQLNEEMPWIALRSQDIEANPGRRQFAKLCQNAALGKLSQGDTKRQTTYVRHWKELMDLRSNPRYKILSIHPIHDALAEVVYERKASMLGLHRNTQVVVYSHVTAFARITMMRDMQNLMQRGYRLFYTDTDSIIFDMPRRETEAFAKDFKLGSPSYGFYKEETVGDIISYCSLGCKNYSLVTDADEHIVKVRGFSLSGKHARDLLTAKTIREMTEAFLKRELREQTTEQFSMRINRQRCTVTNAVLKKKYTNKTFDKRFVIVSDLEQNPHGETVPFGAKHTNYSDVKRR
jgi:hypothetical protein